MSTDSNEVPVSVVDMDVPVTAIDEVLEDYERHIVENETTSITRIESAGSKGTKNDMSSASDFSALDGVVDMLCLYSGSVVSIQYS